LRPGLRSERGFPGGKIDSIRGLHAAMYVGHWPQSFREFRPRQKPGSFNLDRVMEVVTKMHGPGLGHDPPS
jgi:hypothetical protein